jgi:hypothetical protein
MKSKTILAILLITGLSLSVFAQDWKEIDIDQNVSASVPAGFERNVIDDGIIRISAKLNDGNLVIERHYLPEGIVFEDSIQSVKLLEAYCGGYLGGVGLRTEIEIVENDEFSIGLSIARKVQFNELNGKINKLIFFKYHQFIYLIKLDGNFVEMDRILSSIRFH